MSDRIRVQEIGLDRDEIERRKALVYLGEFPAEPDEAVRAFREIMELMAPDVVVIPHVAVPPDKGPGELYRRMREIAVEYARRMEWGWEETQDPAAGPVSKCTNPRSCRT